ncbi:CHAT domain-containing protein [Microcoleus sp. herbarium14]|uniref:CHAT domain-containing tetratricopeptide repeat protein n=1 Tax=Microcoleus sp. herbarium14 TaxID=3055439 RepID=UPI002FD12C05
MNEERLEAYLNLINGLLNCHSGEEERILNANLELVDAGFVEAITQVADVLEEKGERNTANFLINLSRQLAEAMELSSSAPTSSPPPNPESQLSFLKQVLRATLESNGDPQAVYSLLQANLELLDDNFATTVLRSWATATLPELEPKPALRTAEVIGEFSKLIRQFPLGNPAINVEIAITGCEVAATVFTRESFPKKWARLQNNLGSAYLYRIQGEKAENLEVAMRFFLDALEIFNRQDSPQLWATLQNNLGAAYYKRIREERAENLEAAICCYLAALEVRTQEDFCQSWAETQNNLGGVYLDRIRGERAENLEVAIRCYLAALKVHTSKAFAEQWATLQNNLGNAYSQRLWGERAENLEAAIRCYLAALEVRTCEALPEQWASTQNNLGNAYGDHIRGKQAENWETAIRCYLAALKVYTRQTFPYDWAMTQNNLGVAYRNRIQKEQVENLEAAIRCYSATLEVYSQEGFPYEWARSQHNLGGAYRNRIHGEMAENLEVAIRYYLAALEVRTQDNFPYNWAETQNALGHAYLDRFWGERKENLEVAMRFFSAALEVRTCEAFPEDHAVTKANLGFAYQNDKQFLKACSVFAAAIDTVESLRGEIVSGSGSQEDKQRLAERWNELYQRMVEVCVELSKYTEALEYADRSKTRNLVELIFTRDTNTIFPPEIVSQLEQLRDEISSGQYQLQTAIADNPTALAQHLQQLRKQRNQLQDRYLPIGYGFNFERFQETLDDHTTIIQWYITSAGFETFIITRHTLQRLNLPTSGDDLNNLIDWANEYLEAYGRRIKTQWINSLASRLSRLAEILHLEDTIKLVPDTCDRLILIPHRFLHLFPLHALPLANGNFLCDRFPRGVGYAPSCQLLQLAQKREQHRHEFTRILAIQNPTRTDLPILTGTEIQLEKICQHFESGHSIVLREKEATEAALINEQVHSPHCLHFCCHGSFDFGSPLKSALHLAESEDKLGADADLTLGKIFEKLNLDQCRLVTFSACETGITDPTSISDEYVGLLSAFLYAGSPSVVSTLWSVEQAATNLFMIEFYKNLKQLLPLKPGSVAIALNQTQKWLRTLTGEELKKLVESPEFQRHLDDNKNKLFKELLERGKLKPYPFEKPYYWAAFVATGL